MLRFSYKAFDEHDRETSGEVEAASLEEARARLEADGLRVETLDVVGEPEAVAAAPPESSAVPLREQDFLEYGDALSNLHTSGLPLESGLRALSEEIPSRRMKRALIAISDRLERGEAWEQIVKSGSVDLPPALAGLFDAQLRPEDAAPVFEGYLHYARRAAEIRRSIWNGLLYSGVLVSVMFAIVLAFLIGIVPDFNKLFEDFGFVGAVSFRGDAGPSLPMLTSFVLAISSLLTKHGLVVFTGFCVFVVAVVASGIRLGRRRRRKMLCAIPLVGPAFRNAALSTFCHLFAVLLKRGVPIQAALRTAATGSGDAVIEQSCHGIAADMETGTSLQEAAQSRRQIPEQLLHIFEWASRPAVFQDALHASGDAYDGQAGIRAGLVPVILEPLFIFTVITVIGTVMFSLFLPLVQLMNELS